ncbi:MAG TPA: peptide-methionine (S)-S-oxide reductase MsrA [Gemmatimonadales bacterium]|jgi:peptide-methionine (S)-S-oxide reductase
MSRRAIPGIALAFAVLAVGTPRPATAAAAAPADTAVFAGGCFWGIQAVFARVKGVISATSGYSGGHLGHPSYDEVSTGTTGHAESVEVVYDPARVSYDQLLAVFFTVAHDPTELNRQGPDEGTQYRSAIFYRNPDQQRAAQAYIARATQAKTYSRPIVTQITAFTAFYPAEAYHQNFYDTHPTYPYIVINDKPKVEHLRQQFPSLYQAR